MRFIRTALVSVVALGGLAVAAPANAATGVGTLSVNCAANFETLRAIDIQEDGQGQDEIFTIMNGGRFPAAGSVPFVPGQRRNGTDFRLDAGNIAFLDHLVIELKEDDTFKDDSFGTQTISCLEFTDTEWHLLPTVKWFAGGDDVEYHARISVRRL